jgi:hypothetical protein
MRLHARRRAASGFTRSAEQLMPEHRGLTSWSGKSIPRGRFVSTRPGRIDASGTPLRTGRGVALTHPAASSRLRATCWGKCEESMGAYPPPPPGSGNGPGNGPGSGPGNGPGYGYGNGPGSVGRRLEEAMELIEMELRHAAAYVNDAVIPQVRRESISAMRTVADKLRNLADRMDSPGSGSAGGPRGGQPGGPPSGQKDPRS